MKQQIPVLIIFVIGMLISPIACFADLKRPELASPSLATDVVVDMAVKEATKKRPDLSRFEIDSVSYNYVRRVWFVGFSTREPTVELGSSHFTMIIEEANDNSVRYEPGI